MATQNLHEIAFLLVLGDSSVLTDGFFSHLAGRSCTCILADTVHQKHNDNKGKSDTVFKV